MASQRCFASFARYAILTLVATAAFAGGPGFRGGPYHGSPAVRVLPRGYVTYRYRGNPWYFRGGHWYRPWRGSYIGGYPPIGLSISLLPYGYSTFSFGGVPYYSYQDVYYTDAPSGGYLVAEPPPEESSWPSEAPDPNAAALDTLLIVPEKGQSVEQMEADRKKAHSYALSKSRYDPAHSNSSDPGTPRARQAYLRAMKSYLEERGYSVQ